MYFCLVKWPVADDKLLWPMSVELLLLLLLLNIDYLARDIFSSGVLFIKRGRELCGNERIRGLMESDCR